MANLSKDSHNLISGIYCIVSPTGKIYIGQSINLKKRLSSYYGGCGARHSPRLYNSIKKYGFDNHSTSILIECEEKYLNFWEVFYIKLFDCCGTDHGMNLRTGGDNSRHTQESIAKMRIVQKGKVFSEATREKMRQNNLGRIRPQSDKDKISASHKLITKSVEHQENINKSRAESEKVKAALKALAERKNKKVINTLTGEIYNSAKEISAITGRQVARDIREGKGVYKWAS